MSTLFSSFVCHSSPLSVISTPTITLFSFLYWSHIAFQILLNFYSTSESLAILIAFSHDPLPRLLNTLEEQKTKKYYLAKLPHSDDINSDLFGNLEKVGNMFWMASELHAELALAFRVCRREDAYNHPEEKLNFIVSLGTHLLNVNTNSKVHACLIGAKVGKLSRDRTV